LFFFWKDEDGGLASLCLIEHKAVFMRGRGSKVLTRKICIWDESCIYEMQRCNSFGRARFAFGMVCGGMARTDSRQMSASRRRCAFRLRLSNLDCESGQFDLPQLWTKRQQRTRQQSNKKKQNRKQNRAASQFVRAAWGFQQERLESTR